MTATRALPRPLAALPAWIAALSLTASAPNCAVSNDVETLEPPFPEGYARVSEMLGVRCGSLDCHGDAARPLRIYSGRGMRLDAADIPGQSSTTEAEHVASLRSAFALEPSRTSEVVREGGRHPERLTLYRKALGLEHHKGDAPLARDGVQDRCLASWLERAVDVTRCEQASAWERPR